MILARVKEILTDFIKVLGYGRNDARTAPQVYPSGIDTKPIINDLAVYAKTSNIGEPVILGYIRNSDITSPGETRIFGRDQDGNEVFDIYLKNDGTCEFGGNADNMVRFSDLETAYNQLKSDLNAHITNWNAFAAAYIPGSPVFTGTPPTATTSSPSTGNISLAKIDNIKTN